MSECRHFFIGKNDQLKLVLVLNDESERAPTAERRNGRDGNGRDGDAGSMNESDRERGVGEARRS